MTFPISGLYYQRLYITPFLSYYHFCLQGGGANFDVFLFQLATDTYRHGQTQRDSEP